MIKRTAPQRGKTERGISSSVVAPVLQALRDLGMQPPASAPSADGNVPGTNADAMLNAAAAKISDPALGISLAQRIPMGALGPLDYGLVTASSLREGLTRTAAYYGVVTERVALALLEEPPHAIVALTRLPEIDHSRHWMEFSLAMITTRIREAVGPEFTLKSVAFVHPAPESTKAHERFFGVPLEFSSPRDQLVFAQSWLDRPLRTAASALASVLETHLRALQSPRATDDPFLTRLRQTMSALLEQREVSLQAAVERMSVSRRTLQRELQRRGVSHQILLDELRRERALQLLEDARNTVASVAEQLGFSEPSAFFRAFRRWTGTSPSSARVRRS
jgi:AraC-like DNA-binding protein